MNVSSKFSGNCSEIEGIFHLIDRLGLFYLKLLVF